MNVKKIMGAVLVALLAAALFVGAGAAADPVKDGSTVFLYQDLTADQKNLTGTWTNGEVSLSLSEINGQYFFAPTENFKAGTYTNGTGDSAWSITIEYPTATIVGIGTANNQDYIIPNGGTLYTGNYLNLSNSTGATIKPYAYYVTDADGKPTVYPDNTTAESNITKAVGQYKVQVIFNGNDFVKGTPTNLLVSKDAYIINVVSSDEVTISAAEVESVYKGQIIAVTITGKAGEVFQLEYGSCFEYSTNGTVPYDGKANGAGEFTIPNYGKAVIYVKAIDDGNGKISVTSPNKAFDKQSVSIKVTEGSITAETEKESYFVGNDVKISGTSNAGVSKLYVYIKGTNIELTNLTGVTISVENGEFEKKILGSDLAVKADSDKKLDAGTYTLYISTVNPTEFTTKNLKMDVDNLDELGIYGTATLVLKQPFLSVTDAPAVAVKGSKYTVTGTAEATDDLAVYVFGTNYFAATNGTDDVTGFEKNVVEVDGNEFTVEFKVTDDMAAGQYFMVIQHPMYDNMYNIAANESWDIVKNATGNAAKYYGPTVFNVKDRQTANAAQALCDELDLQNIDDMYVKLSFVVASATSTINPIPSEITQGSKLTISGTTNLGEGEVVTVELLSTAFAAVPKETVGSASFIALTTKTNEDGSWEVTFDTTGLNVDEYTVSVAVADLDATTAKINVIEGAPTEQPTENPTEQPTQTEEQPTEAPATPGFGAVAALAGLGAVAVLLLRRE